MRNPIAPLTREAVKPVEAKPEAPARERLASGRSFAELLAEAESVRDHIEISARGAARPALPGLVQSAAAFLARQAPWMGLPLLLHQGAAGETTSERPPGRERRKS